MTVFEVQVRGTKCWNCGPHHNEDKTQPGDMDTGEEDDTGNKYCSITTYTPKDALSRIGLNRLLNVKSLCTP